MTYPFAGDAPIARARRVAQAYRAALDKVDHGTCAQIDAACIGWGESWVAPRLLTYDLDDMLTPRHAAEVAHVSLSALRDLRRRGRLVGVKDDRGVWRYRARDVLAVISATRRRRGVGNTAASQLPSAP